MTPRTIRGSVRLGAALRRRREELGLTIEHAARAAAVGSETWRRYETGGSIRRDKVRGICAALRWRSLPEVDVTAGSTEPTESWESYPKDRFDDSYSEWLAEWLGSDCARAFAFGCDVLLDQTRDDLSELGKQARGTHIGQLGVSWLEGSLPPRWVPRYDYDFVYRLRHTIDQLRLRAVRPGFDGVPHLTRSVADDLALHLILESGMSSAEAFGSDAADDWTAWEYELNGEDDEVVRVLFSDTTYVGEESPFHFDRWFEPR
jgi:hypothetical protein